MPVSRRIFSRRLVLADALQPRWETVPLLDGDLGSNQVLVRSLLGAIKSGTEGAYYSGDGPLNGWQLDLHRRLFRPRTEPLWPMPAGNMTCGEVIGVGSAVTRFRTGDRVYGWLPISQYHVVGEDRVYLLDELTETQALFIDPLIYALGARHDAGDLAGKTVLVLGLGAIGLLVVALARLAGATVFAASRSELRRQAAVSMGARRVYDAGSLDVAEAIKEDLGGPEVVFECSGKGPQLELAVRAARQMGTVVTVGFYAGTCDVCWGLEALHNRLSILFSLTTFRWGNVTRDGRTYADLRDEAVTLLKSGALPPVDGLLQPILPFAQAADAYSLIGQPQRTLKIGIRYPSEE